MNCQEVGEKSMDREIVSRLKRKGEWREIEIWGVEWKEGVSGWKDGASEVKGYMK